jgi:hypothetical protein
VACPKVDRGHSRFPFSIRRRRREPSRNQA